MRRRSPPRTTGRAIMPQMAALISKLDSHKRRIVGFKRSVPFACSG